MTLRSIVINPSLNAEKVFIIEKGQEYGYSLSFGMHTPKKAIFPSLIAIFRPRL